MTNKIISFVIWGDEPIYIIGAIKNAILAQSIYPEWECRFYVDKIASNNPNIKYLNSLSNTKIVFIDEIGGWIFNIKRFYPLIDREIDYTIFRDCDSRLSYREKEAVDEWIAGGKMGHIMRDHPFHFNYPILAGMFGCKRISFDESLFLDATDIGNFSDQLFLQKTIWPIIKDDSLIHDSTQYNTGKKFPTERKNKEFVGDSFDILDNRHPEYFKYITG
jgi:hypothetical protein